MEKKPTNKITVTVTLSNKEKVFKTLLSGISLIKALREMDMVLETPCDGRGTCGKCKVKAVGSLSEKTEKEISELGHCRDDTIRLACQATITGDVHVQFNTFAPGDGIFGALNEGKKQLPFNQTINGVTLKDNNKTINSPREIIEKSKLSFCNCLTTELLQNLESEVITQTSYCEAVVKKKKIIDIRFTKNERCLGVALDIGTTGMVAVLADMESGVLLSEASCLNPQVVYGGDVITRIDYARKHKEGTKQLQLKVTEGINKLINQLCFAANVKQSSIYSMTVAANNTMLHLLLGVNPAQLAVAPYQPVFTDIMEVRPSSVGVEMAKGGLITLLPSASAFVGSDIIAGLTACDFHRLNESSLFIDLGTNGEIVLNVNNVLVATSTAAGPAFEGMNIGCGCRAKKGAVEKVFISETGEVSLKTIGEGTPIGICGSGLIDLVSKLLKLGIIQSNGRLNRTLSEDLSKRLANYSGKLLFKLDEAGDIYLSQKDVREFQLAKGAVAAGISLLLKDMEVEWEDINKVYIAGAFGYYLDPESLVTIGVIPESLKDSIIFTGNASREGALMCLLNPDVIHVIKDIKDKTTIKELAFHPEFQKYFVKHISFPRI